MKRFFFFLILVLSPVSLHAEWEGLGPGFEHQHSEEPNVHFFRIDPKKFRLDILLASQFGVAALNAEGYRQKSGALLVVNGGFFDDAFRSLGLLHRQGTTINPLRNASWGVFLLTGRDGREPKMIPQKTWPLIDAASVALALEAGPRLVVNGKVQRFKEGVPSRRSAIGITRGGWIEIALAETPMSLKDWAVLLQKDCAQALNLDGGGSSQISISEPKLSLKVEGLTNVPNAVAVFRK